MSMLYKENIKVSTKGVVFTDKHGRELSLNEALKKISARIYNWYLDFKLFLIHLVSLHVPFYSIRKLFFVISGVKIGSGSTIHMGCRFFEPRKIVIGKDSKIGNNAFLDGRAQLTIGDHVDIASQVLIYNSEHDLDDPEFKAIEQPVEIGDYVFIGPRVVILPGVKIGKGAVIAASAVVTKDVPEFTIVGGVPAKEIGERRNNNLVYKLGRARLFQ